MTWGETEDTVKQKWLWEMERAGKSVGFGVGHSASFLTRVLTKIRLQMKIRSDFLEAGAGDSAHAPMIQGLTASASSAGRGTVIIARALLAVLFFKNVFI